MEDRKLNEQESIELITKMINNTRSRVERNSGLPFIVMGYTTVAVSLAVWYAFISTHNPMYQWLWMVIPAVGFLMGFLGRRKRSNEVRTYIDRILGYTWNVLGVVAFAISMMTFSIQIPTLFVILLLIGIGVVLTGLIIKDKLSIITGFISAIILAPLCLVVEGIDSCLIFAAAFVIMMVIPGHIINYRSNRRK